MSEEGIQDDKELLTLAAKAAGENYGPDNSPLEDDALAFGLMVRLKIDVAFHPRCVSVGDAPLEVYGDDPYAAVRRAIAKAAAEIGREMK